VLPNIGGNVSAVSAKSDQGATAHTTKAVDELYRLLEFAKGRPDSRPAPDYLRLFTAGQLRIFETWITEARQREEEGSQ
jgi:hypothetical protein